MFRGGFFGNGMERRKKNGIVEYKLDIHQS